MMTPRIFLFLAAIAAAPPPPAANAGDALGDQLGTIRFETSGPPAARTHVVRGVKLLHHMMYAEADREFSAAIEADPKCALAHWGRAMALLHPLWPEAPTEADLAAGAAHLERALACPPKTPREHAYVETLRSYFNDGAARDHASRLHALDTAATAQAERFPEDFDALAFSALFHLAPARFQPKDKSHRLQLEAAADLKKVLAAIPDHPGAQHYKIHAYDFPLLADRALEVCDTYGGIAPDVPHALHMPTHIYTRRGLWDKSIEFNLRSAAAARKLAAAAGALNGHQPHALDYLAYAYLQRGQYREAERVRDEILSLHGPYTAAQRMQMAFAFAAVPARCVLERQQWTAAAQLPFHQPATFEWTDDYLNCDSIVRFARALGAARSNQLDAARTEINELERLHRKLSVGKRPRYWSAQAETQLLAARAWVEFREGQTDTALVLMRRAAEIEATTDKEAVTPGEVLPAGDLLGDLLLEANRPDEALAAFEAVLTASPNRFNTLFGAAHAAERMGNTPKARDYYSQLLASASAADPGNARLEHARSYLQRVASR